jgi:hypothetical protein
VTKVERNYRVAAGAVAVSLALLGAASPALAQATATTAPSKPADGAPQADASPADPSDPGLVDGVFVSDAHPKIYLGPVYRGPLEAGAAAGVDHVTMPLRTEGRAGNPDGRSEAPNSTDGGYGVNLTIPF